LIDRIINYCIGLTALQQRENRDMLLRGLPSKPVAALARSTAPLTDISTIVQAVAAWGRLPDQDTYALTVVLENSRDFVAGLRLEQELDGLLAQVNAPAPHPSREDRSSAGTGVKDVPANQAFICYAHEDEAVAAQLYHDLKQAGVAAWIACEDILPGERWKSAIKKAMKHSVYFITILSAQSVSKTGYVQKELKEALDWMERMPPSAIFLIPVRIDSCEPEDERLQDIQWVNLFPFEAKYHDGVQRILRVLRPNRRAAKQERPQIEVQVKEEQVKEEQVKEDMHTSTHQPPPQTKSSPESKPNPLPPPSSEPEPEPPPQATGPPPPPIRLRSEPKPVSKDMMQQECGLTLDEKTYSFPVWRPVECVQNQYEDRSDVIIDHATGLTWQKSGSSNYMTYQKAQEYVKQLNRERFAGFNDWRLPTIPELMSLLEPEKSSNGLYLNSIF
ncbi:MAG: TIR domain-containing protein, partial [Rhodobacteraceae bacterium]|nr:TIR domain-containing protein [Paracoccaceae bacterium]